MSSKKLRIINPTRIGGKHIEVGEIVTVSDNLAKILVSGNKAEEISQKSGFPRWPGKETADGAKGASTPEEPIEETGGEKGGKK